MTTKEAAEEIAKAYQLPLGYSIFTDNEGYIIIGNSDLCFCITPLSIRDNRHMEIVKNALPALIRANVEGNLESINK